METLRAELARAKEQARSSNAAALKAAEELRAEKAAHCKSKEKMAKMAVELKGTADRCRLLEKENRAKATDLEKATMADKDTRSAMRAKKEELREAGDIVAGKPFILWRKFGDPRYAPLDRLWSSATHIWTWRRALSMRPNTSEIKQIVKWTSYSGQNLTFQSVRFH